MARKNDDFFDEDGGLISEWNEGKLKSLRLHEIQELINTAKLNPLVKRGDKWGYQSWIDGVTLLYGEGQSKYKEKEIKEVERVKNLIEDKMMVKSPHQILIDRSMNNSSRKYKIDYEVWKELKKLIELYEKIVKKLNDEHGLSTRNIDYDLEGL